MKSFILLFLFFARVQSAAPCKAVDRRALLFFKSAITNNALSLSSWKENANCCKGWVGVKCNKTTGKVIELSLSTSTSTLSKSISGTIHESLGSLSNLIKLNLSYNRLKGSIPNSITRLVKLQVLDIAYNYGIAGSIPNSIGNMTSLVRIRIQSNKIRGPIPASFGMLSNLVYAELNDNALTGRVPDEFTRHTTRLSFLELSQNMLNGLPPNLANLKFLRVLYMGSNKLTSFESIRGISTLPMLGELHLGNCGLQGPIPKWLATLNLRQSDDFITSLLDLSHNAINGSIPQEIEHIGNIDILSLANNGLSGHIPFSIGKLTGLLRLDLENNKLSGPIPNTFLGLHSLRGFNVSNNMLQGKIPQGVPFASFDASSFQGNTGLCGHPLPPCKN